MKIPLVLPSTLALVMVLGTSCSSDDDDNDAAAPSAPDAVTETSAVTEASIDAMTFFLTSNGPGDGANLGGLPGADVHCADLAEMAGSNGREWRAYLSTTGADGINAIDRIGDGPWTNATGAVVAESVADLLSDSNNLTRETALTESGDEVNGIGDSPNRHDILTGTELNGLASTSTSDTTCANWTSNDAGSALVGHHDRDGGGPNPMSWSTAHGTPGCSQINLRSVGGDGLFYCFATN